VNIVFVPAVSIHGVSEVLGQTAGLSYPHQKGQLSYQCISADIFRGTVQQRFAFSPLDFYLWGDFKSPSVFTSN